MRLGLCSWRILLLFLFTLAIGCQKDSSSPAVDPLISQISSPEYENELLFVNRGEFQIATTEPATFSSPDPRAQITPGGVITRITSGAVVPIDVHWTASGESTRIYALGATDDQHDEPYASYHGVLATDPMVSYRLGWKTLQKLPRSDSTYAIILRHADASIGRDDSDGPANWWKSCDPDRARQLNDTGKVHSTELGVIFKELGFPISRVISSEFCRAKTTAELINAGPAIILDGRINHPEHNTTGRSLFGNMLELIGEQPVDNTMTLLVTHHPINETRNVVHPTFPSVSPFPWTGAYIVKVAPDKMITYEGAVSFDMFRYHSNKKMNRITSVSY